MPSNSSPINSQCIELAAQDNSWLRLITLHDYSLALEPETLIYLGVGIMALTAGVFGCLDKKRPAPEERRTSLILFYALILSLFYQVDIRTDDIHTDDIHTFEDNLACNRFNFRCDVLSAFINVFFLGSVLVLLMRMLFPPVLDTSGMSNDDIRGIKKADILEICQQDMHTFWIWYAEKRNLSQLTVEDLCFNSKDMYKDIKAGIIARDNNLFSKEVRGCLKRAQPMNPSLSPF